MAKATEKVLAYGFGVVFIVVLLIIAFKFPNPTPFQYVVFRSVLSIAVAGSAAFIPGFLSIQIQTWMRAGGALAVFVAVYFYNPASLVATPYVHTVVSGTVRSDSGASVSGAVVTFEGFDPNSATRSTSDGTFAADVVIPAVGRPATIHVERDGYEATETAVMLDAQNVKNISIRLKKK